MPRIGPWRPTRCRAAAVSGAARACAAAAAATAVLLATSRAAAQPPAGSPAEPEPGETTIELAVLVRGERWGYFAPPGPSADEPDYAFPGARATLAIEHRGVRWRARGAFRYVRLESLPAGASDADALGTGGLYRLHVGRSFSYQLFLRELALGVDAGRGVRVTAGRQAYASGREAPPASPAVAALRPRIEGRLLGSASWSLYERAFDAARVDVARPRWRATIMAGFPTQGVFEESANLPMRRLRVAGGALALEGRGASETQLFAYHYRDRRAVSIRPDNTRRASDGVDIALWTLGASHLAVASTPAGLLDGVLWGAVQAGRWYELAHRAWSAAAEAGHRWTRAPGQPWVRAGVSAASGDRSPGDGRHGTFFPLLPGGEAGWRSALYASMNVVDAFAELRVRPHRRLEAGAGLRRVALASVADRWYTGSGATRDEGAYFGYAARPSAGAATLATIAQGVADLSLSRRWTARAEVAYARGGEVVRRSFTRRPRLVFVSIASAFRF